MLDNLQLRNAKIYEAYEIAEIINRYAMQEIMLPKTPEMIIEKIRNYIVAVIDGKIVGCCGVSFFNEELAEVISLAVKEEYQKRGIGRALVQKIESIMREEGIKKSISLTLNVNFFKKIGYSVISKDEIPQKIWRDCVNCSKLMRCDEVAMVKYL